MPIRGLFITGTDTGVGKTSVSMAIVRSLVGRGLRVGVYKPVASGIVPDDPAGDPRLLWEAAGRPLTEAEVCPQRFRAPISPPASARAEGREVDERLLSAGYEVWSRSSDVVIVEGAGGLFTPLSDRVLNVDLARRLGVPLVLVDAARLGAIGRTLAACEAAAARGLRLAAVVLSHVQPPATGDGGPADPASIARESGRELARRLDPVPVVTLAHGGCAVEPAVDWEKLARGG
ncbi:MAG: dethiobiotin synthase [Planctomycetia bacterium]